MSDPRSKLSTRVEVFTRVTGDAVNRAIGEVLAARNPWQLLHRLSRIVFLGLVLYLGWILVVVQPDVARRLMRPLPAGFQQRYEPRRQQVEAVLRAAVAAESFGVHALLVAEWDGGSSVKVLGVQGRGVRLPLEAGQESLVGIAMAKVMGHVALGLCESERPAALDIDESQLPPGSRLMVCPIGCTYSAPPHGLLVAIFEPPGEEPGVLEASGAGGQQPSGQKPGRRTLIRVEGRAESWMVLTGVEARQRRQREQLMVLARRLAGVLQ